MPDCRHGIGNLNLIEYLYFHNFCKLFFLFSPIFSHKNNEDQIHTHTHLVFSYKKYLYNYFLYLFDFNLCVGSICCCIME